MKVSDDGFYLGSKKYGESSSITFVLSRKNGLIKGFTRFSKKERNNFSILDKITFVWNSKTKEGLGFLKIDLHEISKKIESSFISELIKASTSELCLKCLPFWQNNIEIFNNVEILFDQKKSQHQDILIRYVWWEILFLKNIGYGLNLDSCVVSGTKEDIYFISPKTGNAVSFKVGKKYQKHLFKIPQCFKTKNKKVDLKDCIEGLMITGFFLKKNFEKKYSNFIFRNELIKKLKKI